MKHIFFLLFTLSFCLSSCSKKKTVQNAAKAYCQCLQASAEFNQKQEALVKANDADSLAKLIPIGKAINEEAFQCLAQYEAEYGDIARSEKFKREAFKIVEQECPNVYQYIPAHHK